MYPANSYPPETWLTPMLVGAIAVIPGDATDVVTMGFFHFNGARCAQTAPPREMAMCYQDERIRGHEINFVVYGVRIAVRVFFSGACGSTRRVCKVFSTTLGCSCNYSSLLWVSRMVLSFRDSLQTYNHFHRHVTHR